MDCLLGIDVGTTGIKAILGNTKGNIVAETSVENTLSSPKAGWAEEDANQWWENIGQVCRRLREQHPEVGIAATGVSGMVPTIVLLDTDDRPLRPSIQQNDARSHEEIIQFQAQTDEANILARTGSAVTQQSIGPLLTRHMGSLQRMEGLPVGMRIIAHR